MTRNPHKQPRNAVQAFSYIVGAVMTSNLAWAADPTCLSYYTVGDSDCKPVASTPVKRPQTAPATAPQLVQPVGEVDKFLDNYGKPPREFVEFYLNPTSENARKWVATYQGIIQKGQDISKAWNQADELYKGAGTSTAPVLQGTAPAVTEPPVAAAVMAPPAMAPQPVATSFGAFAEQSQAGTAGPAGVRNSPIDLTYYFSQTCPYCAKMTPDLAALSKEKSGKLELTCVDVTPVGPRNRPDEAYITSKLPCKWRLPEEGEVDREAVRQTPTLVIRKGGVTPVRLSGYVPLAQLRQYF